jgi:class 3 adenylate cyclase/HAMP domain-containing protein
MVATILLAGLSSSYSARAGITRIAVEALGFKAQELQKYAENQWELLVNNNLTEQQEYLDVTKLAVESYAASLIRSNSELIFAVDANGSVVMSTSPLAVDDEAEQSDLVSRAGAQEPGGWTTITIGGEERVGQAFRFEPFGWLVFVTNTSDNFYSEARQIERNTYFILGGAVLLAIILLWIFSLVLTGPLSRMVNLMNGITETNDLSERVNVEYRDEIGAMATTFNHMLAKLEATSDQIKGFAFRAVVAQRNERKIRSIFQKYVPQEVIDSVFANPESALVGENRILAILFTDIRSFTTISENFAPDELVKSLNSYFEMLIDIISAHGGTPDKYIGDAVMAFFGAPVRHENDPLEAVKAALEMQEAIAEFNRKHAEEGKPPFKTGIGINYGVVTVGNIGSDKKMDYTIIGESVNLGSRLESLTKHLGQDVIFSETVYRKLKVNGELVLPCRLLNKIQPKGTTRGVNIYTAARTLTPRQQKAWGYHHAGVKHFRSRNFQEAARFFAAVRKLLPDDKLAELYLEDCARFVKNPPPADWDGTLIMSEK